MATSSLAALTKDVGVLAKKQRSSAKKNAAAVSGLLKHLNACRTALSNGNNLHAWHVVDMSWLVGCICLLSVSLCDMQRCLEVGGGLVDL